MNLLPFVLLIVAQAGFSLFSKPAINHLPRIKALWLMYFFSAVLGFLFWFLADGTAFTFRDFLLVGVGLAFLNSIGAQLQWSANKISMSRTSLFLPLIGVLAALLFAVFLQEYKSLNFLTIAGFSLHLVAIWLFRASYAGKKSGSKESHALWLTLTVALVVNNALLLFFTKVLAFDIPTAKFVPLLYFGCFVYLGIMALLKKEQQPAIYKPQLFFLVPLVSIFAVGFMASQYWIFKENSGIAAVSFVALSSTFVPAMAGWLVFKEGKGLSKTEMIGFLCGIAAAILIISSH